MSIEIPVWLLYVLYALGGLLLIAALVVVGGLAFAGWLFMRTWRPPNW